LFSNLIDFIKVFINLLVILLLYSRLTLKLVN